MSRLGRPIPPSVDPTDPVQARAHQRRVSAALAQPLVGVRMTWGSGLSPHNDLSLVVVDRTGAAVLSVCAVTVWFASTPTGVPVTPGTIAVPVGTKIFEPIAGVMVAVLTNASGAATVRFTPAGAGTVYPFARADVAVDPVPFTFA